MGRSPAEPVTAQTDTTLQLADKPRRPILMMTPSTRSSETDESSGRSTTICLMIELHLEGPASCTWWGAEMQ